MGKCQHEYIFLRLRQGRSGWTGPFCAAWLEGALLNGGPMNRRQFVSSLAAAPALAAPALGAATGRHKEPYQGVFIIMQTPFLESLEIDGDSLRREADFLVRCGVHGMVWPAGAGETSTLSHDEREKFSKFVVD